MKKFLLAIALLITSASLVTSEAQNISVSINIGSQPAWGPVGYDYVDYYYIPEINVYYNVPLSMFYYWNRGRWISAQYLPYSYRNYDLYHMYKVVLNTRDPWMHNRYHVRDYGRYKGVRNQIVIYNSKDNRYRDSKRNTTPWYHDNKKNNYNNNKNYKDNNRYSDNNRYNHNNNRSSVNQDKNRYTNENRKSKIDNNSRANNRSSSDYNKNNSNRGNQNRDKAIQSQRNKNSERSSNKSSGNNRNTASKFYYTQNSASSGNANSNSRSERSSRTKQTSERKSSERSRSGR